MNPSSHLPALPFTLYPTKFQKFFRITICVLFVVGGVYLVRDGEMMGWFAIGFFGCLCLPIFLLQLDPKRSFLTVSDRGLEMGTLSKVSVIPWEDISEFGVQIQRHRGIRVSAKVAFNFSASYAKQARTRAILRGLNRFEGMLPDTYGRKAEELSGLLAAIHREKVGIRHTTSLEG